MEETSAAPRLEVQRLVRDLHAAWMEERFENLYPFFDERVIVVPPGPGGRTVGREATVDSFRQFMAAAKVHAFEILDLQVDVFEATAVAALRFRIRYEMEGTGYDEKGKDLLVLNRDGDAWRIVWRTMIAEQA